MWCACFTIRYCFKETIGFDVKPRFQGIRCRVQTNQLIYKKVLRKGYSVPRDFMNWKWQTETPSLRNLGRNKRLLYRLPDKLNTFRRNKTIHHADIITYFNCLFLKADKYIIRRGKIIHFHNVQKSEKSFTIYLHYLKNELVKASSLKPSMPRTKSILDA